MQQQPKRETGLPLHLLPAFIASCWYDAAMTSMSVAVTCGCG